MFVMFVIVMQAASFLNLAATPLCLSAITEASSITNSFKSSSFKFFSPKALIKQLNTASTLWDGSTECCKTSVPFRNFVIPSNVTSYFMFKISVTSSCCGPFIPSTTKKLNNDMVLRFATASLVLQEEALNTAE